MKNKIKKGITVKVMTGKYKGKEGLVTHVIRKKDLVIVEGVNVKKKALKISDTNNENYQFILRPIHISNVKLVSESTTVVESGSKSEPNPKAKKSLRKKSK